MTSRKRAPRKSRQGSTLRDRLSNLTREQLLDVVEEIATSYPSVAKALEDRLAMRRGSVQSMVDTVRREIEWIGAIPVDWNKSREPDYPAIQQRLEWLLTGGYADELIELVELLVDQAISAYQMDHNDDDPISALVRGLDLAYRALPLSSLSPSQQIIWAIDVESRDDWGILGESDEAIDFWEAERSPEDWSDVATELLRRLPPSDDAGTIDVTAHDRPADSYDRDRLTDSIIMALDRAGRDEEIIPLCQREAEVTMSYARLVRLLVNAGRDEEAEIWIHRGVEATKARLPGIAKQLRELLIAQRMRQGRPEAVAAARATEFFLRPSLASLAPLEAAADALGHGSKVQQAARHFLETGLLPLGLGSDDRPDRNPWPLPPSDIGEDPRDRTDAAPMGTLLLDLALRDGDPSEVLRWYDQQVSEQRWGMGEERHDRIAGALASAYPDRAMAIWRHLAEAQIRKSNTRAYGAAARSLRKIRDLSTRLGRQDEWQTYLRGLEAAHVRKTRLIEILHGLPTTPSQ